jgi:GNAT superfamily N-acetyltransferase
LLIREATIFDIEELHKIRVAVNENRLSDPNKISVQDYRQYLTVRGKGWIAEKGGNIIGFSIVDTIDHSVWALFVHPAFESRGVGRQLHDTMINWYFHVTDVPLTLSTSADTRAERFYRKAGWNEKGISNGEIIFQLNGLQK